MKARMSNPANTDLDFMTLYLGLHLALEYDFSDIADAATISRNAVLINEVIAKMKKRDATFHANHLRVMSMSLDILENTINETGEVPDNMTHSEALQRISLNRNIIHKGLLDMGIDINEI